MGKQVTVAVGFSNVELPRVITVGGVNGYPATKQTVTGGYNPGDVVVLTNAEYAALPQSVLRALGTATNVAEPFRPSADPAAQTINAPSATTGTIQLTLGFNNVGPITGPVTLALANVAWTGGTRSSVLALVSQDVVGSRVLTQPTGVRWAGGSAPVLTVTASKADFFEYWSIDGGVTVFGRIVSANS